MKWAWSAKHIMLAKSHNNLSFYILLSILFGILAGIFLNILKPYKWETVYYLREILDIGGKLFLNILKMLVVPVVFVSLICGTFNLNKAGHFGRTAGKTILLYLLTTAVAITLALSIASMIGIGGDLNAVQSVSDIALRPPSLKQTLVQIIPSNPVAAMAEGNMVQLIVFSLLLGLAIVGVGEKGKRVQQLFRDGDVVVMNLVTIVFKLAPYGIFCLVAALFARTGLAIIMQLFEYFMVVLLALGMQVLLVYFSLLKFYVGVSPFTFIRNMWTAMLFAFSTSSSNASIPVVLDTVENKLGVDESIASFVVPLGATINMDGTAVMQGVATVFIANAYHIPLGLTGYLTVVLLATLASIGTAGVPGVGLITLTMVLNQVGVPAEGIAMIIGIDRLLDMLRTVVNISGDATISCVVSHSEDLFDRQIFNRTD